ncbi:MAG: TraR/DksA C4-type zinc finger protein [Candidatus Moranbacteria bacterium]|nr:TraR/DksA C4-type zinc finger protein [Candidatus Moranbacteria bacterium]
MAQLKEKLLEEKKRIESELGRIGKPTTDSGDYSTNFNEIGEDEDENASEVEEYTGNLAVEANLEKQLKDIMDALERIEQGTYGKCENCGTDIPVERLLAYPAAKTCLNC